jgi:hypothetical protein
MSKVMGWTLPLSSRSRWQDDRYLLPRMSLEEDDR